MPAPRLQRRALALASLASLASSACGALFPQYTTAVRPVPEALRSSATLTPPGDTLFRIALVRAQLPLHTRDNRPWDDDGTEADPFVTIQRNGTEVFRSATVGDTRAPEWSPARAHVDLRVLPTDTLRIELRDDDGVLSDLVGVYDYTGIPEATRQSTDLHVHFDSGAEMDLEVTPPPPQFGLGVTYQYHRENLVVTNVVETGPAYGSGLRRGDRIVAIDGRPLVSMPENEARGALDHAADHTVVLRIERDSNPATDLTIEPDALYLIR